jgi:hypothetical protein
MHGFCFLYYNLPERPLVAFRLRAATSTVEQLRAFNALSAVAAHEGLS